MRSFVSLGVKAKLRLAFGSLALLVLVVAALSLVSMTRSQRHFAIYVDHITSRLDMARAVLDAAHARAVSERNLVLLSEAKDQQAEKAAVLAAQAELNRTLAGLKQALAGGVQVSAQEQRLFAEVEAVEARYAPWSRKVVALVDAGELDEAVQNMNTECRPLLAALVRATRAYMDHGTERTAAHVADSETAFRRGWMTMLAVAGVAIALAVALSAWLAGGFTRPILDAMRAAQQVAGGDLRCTIVPRGRDETGQLLGALKTMNDGLVALVQRLQDTGERINTGSHEIAAGSVDLSRRTEEQASSLQATASSMEQMNANVGNTAQTALKATELASEASAAAERGGQRVAQVVSTMQEIAGSARQIADITGVIDGIAFQTNILALNAAVEAARAGEQGRGFAVVASEVRSLAQRSAEAARQIKALIGASVEKVETGTRTVADAGSTMEDIVAQVRKVAELIHEIGAATREQASGIGQVNEAVSQLDRTTQQNAALVEQSAASAEGLKALAAELHEVIGSFKLG
ncbi:methyl-accepting chemotaxis protein [Aquabacterium sp. J223]|uniref:methyl-accepting chemotaxis protein n=1 Tax=Aquabacterium sp. J223 TaxID=2898431 RepID=UPI0021ADD698|nr:methyl-accepting chemotaxis protein [Aquabacterium sp. J223]UUX94894.1 methyl-accepting chemotaxis protein [Aquabacterium sp. J223]